jgi:hypothetical protein
MCTSQTVYICAGEAYYLGNENWIAEIYLYISHSRCMIIRRGSCVLYHTIISGALCAYTDKDHSRVGVGDEEWSYLF